MSTGLENLNRAFGKLPRRHAVFDRALRKHTGQWKLSTAVDVEEIVEAFSRYGAFTNDRSEVLIPIHEPDSAEITGQFLAYRNDDLVECVVFYDFSNGKLARIDFDEFPTTYPAWLVRFWGTNHSPDDVPSYLESEPAFSATETSSPDNVVTGRPTAGSKPELFENLRSFVEREREADRDETREAYRSMKRGAYFESHDGLPSARPAGLEVNDFGEQVVHVRADLEADGDQREIDPNDVDLTEEYGLYPGSEVFVDRIDDGEGFPVEAELFDVAGSQLSLGVYWDTSDAKAAAEAAFQLDVDTVAQSDSDPAFCVGALLNPVPYDRQVDAINAIQDHERKREVVLGTGSIAFGDASDVTVSSSDLNTSQRTAAVNALRAEDAFCIHGPPGTGKTRTLTSIVRESVAEGKQVLACAHSNQAVDNLLVGSSSEDRADPRSVHADAQDGDVTIARAGRNTANDVVEAAYVDEDPWTADVVGATMSAASEFPDDLFEVAVIDEATQATIPSTLIPASKAETVILAGDHKQLPPYHSSDQGEVDELEFSLFEHVLDRYGPDAATTLTKQYRMHEEIAAYPNRAFYGDRLTHGQKNRTWTVGSLAPLVAVDVTGTERQTPMNSYYNEAEADAVVDEVERLLDAGVLPEEIGIITPYNGQIGKIRSTIESRMRSELKRRIKVDTIDSFQGGEREAIVVSFVRSNDGGDIGFLDFPVEGPRRLNVALTRARKRLCLIGDWETLRASGDPSAVDTDDLGSTGAGGATSADAGDDDSTATGSDYYADLYEHLERTGVLESR